MVLACERWLGAPERTFDGPVSLEVKGEIPSPKRNHTAQLLAVSIGEWLGL